MLFRFVLRAAALLRSVNSDRSHVEVTEHRFLKSFAAVSSAHYFFESDFDTSKRQEVAAFSPPCLGLDVSGIAHEAADALTHSV
jgi:hypothetical protein